MLTTRKSRDAAIATVEQGHRRVVAQKDAIIKDQDNVIKEYEKRWGSADGKVVLQALQDALNIIRQYQRTLNAVSMADPNHLRANELLERWGMKPYSNPDQGGTVASAPHPIAPRPNETLEDRLAREEEEWGDEAYGKGTVRIEAEAIDEGDEKEPGITRARIRFVEVPEAPYPSDANTAAEFAREAAKEGCTCGRLECECGTDRKDRGGL